MELNEEGTRSGPEASVTLDARLVENFAGVFLSGMYDDPAPTPQFHRECWELYCSDAPLVGIAAPRDHAKSTALTHDFVLAAACFRVESHFMIVSATEELSLAQLGDISFELHENDDLRAEFGIVGFPVDSKGEIVVQCSDGYQFRIIARGAGQKLRGLKWRGRRPGLVTCDDMEEDEQVENLDRRIKFRRWVLRALLPLVRKGGRIRWHGTILHEDSMLARIMKDPAWVSRLYKAHTSFDDFSNILWPEKWDEARLRSKRQVFINQGDAPGYSQEYLNDPLDNSEAYLQKDWFVPMQESDWESPKLHIAAADFAISKKDRANRTSLTIAGKDVSNLSHFIDQRVGRWDSLEIVEELFAVQKAHNPAFFFVEDGQIWLALKPVLQKEMLARQVFINFIPLRPIKDKASRGRSLQRRMRSLATRWATDAHWFPGMQDEMLRFTGYSEATLDDQFDSAALISLGFDYLADLDQDDFRSEEEEDLIENDPRNFLHSSPTTGY